MEKSSAREQHRRRAGGEGERRQGEGNRKPEGGYQQ